MSLATQESFKLYLFDKSKPENFKTSFCVSVYLKDTFGIETTSP